jgi:DNA-binding winged helix-turn-helix (wHTH) protein/tetratricopeptide (TPR) repeat protein
MAHRHRWPHAVGEQEQTQRMQFSSCLVFDVFRLDPRDERLWCGQEAIHLHPKTFAVLCCLVTQAGQLVTKEALHAAVWPDAVVSESTLTVAIRKLRRVLGDTARTPRFIETVHGRGYRFIAPVQASAAPGGPTVRGALRHTPPPRFHRPPHFVGRDAAFTQLRQWWTAAQQGTRQVGVIAGEPGIGKTALVEAFLAEVAAAGACRVGHGQCLEPYGPGEPYRPVLEALGRLGQEPDGPGLVAALRQYAPSWLAQLPALVPPAEREALQRMVGALAPTRMLRELTEALDALTTEQPLLLVVEDLHWSDHATLAWLAAVARRPDPARLLLLGTYRPVDAMVHRHPLPAVLTELQQHGRCAELALDYLSEAAVTAYLGQRFRGTRCAAALARVLHQRTHGNPLFVIAVVEEILRQQVLRHAPAGWILERGVEAISTLVPATLRTLIEHQLAQCSPEVQTLLEAASVAGVEFAAAAVAAGLERTEDDIETQCATLAHQGRFLQARGRATWPDGTVTACFGFRHALYQDVVYHSIPAGRQTRWHARMGARLAQGFGAQAGDMAVDVARHCVRGRLLSQAVPYLRQAGETAFGRLAYQETVTFFEQALDVLRQLPETRARRAQAIDLRLALRGVRNSFGDLGRVLALLREAEVLAEALGDRHRLGQVYRFLADYFYLRGAHDQAIAAAQRALALATTLGDVVLHAVANQYLGFAYKAQGEYRRALDCLRQTAAFFDGAQRPMRGSTELPPAVLARAHLAWGHAELGTFAEGRIFGEAGLRIAEAVAHPKNLMVASWGLGLLALRQGDLPRALPLLERAVGIAQDTELPAWFQRFAPALGAAYTLAGRVADAVPLLTQALTQTLALDIVDVQAFCRLALGEAHLLAGRPEEAQVLAQRALALARAHEERGHQAQALRLLGAIAGRGTPPHTEEAAARYRQARALAEELGMRPLQAHCHQGLGTLYATMGQREQARVELSTAIAMYQSMDMTLWLPQTETALAQVDAQ